MPLEAPVSSAFALVLGLAGHAVGWPIPRGGSQQISNALAGHLRELGGKIEVNHRIEDLSALPKSRAILLDVSVWEFCESPVNKCHRAIAAGRIISTRAWNFQN